MHVRISASLHSNKLVPPSNSAETLRCIESRYKKTSCRFALRVMRAHSNRSRCYSCVFFLYCCVGNNSSTLTEDSSVSRLRAEEYQQRVLCVCLQRFFKPLTCKHAKLCIREGDTFTYFGEFSRLCLSYTDPLSLTSLRSCRWVVQCLLDGL